MSNKFDSRQIESRSALGMIGGAANDTLDTLLPKIDAELAKVFEDRNIMLADGGLVTLNAAGTSLSFTQALKLHINSQVAGGAPTVIDLAATSRTLSANLRMVYAVINRSAGTATVTADATTLPAQTSANQEVVLIAKRIDSADGSVRVIFRDGTSLFAGQTKRLGNSDFAQFTVSTDAATTGSSTTLAAFTSGVVRLTNGSLVSLSGIPASVSERMLLLRNKTGNTVVINNDEVTATAADRILTGTGGNVSLLNDATFLFFYDATTQRWALAGGTGSGSGGGSGSLDTLFTQTFENAILSDFTQTGLIIDTTATDVINGAKSAKLIHQSGVPQSFMQSIVLPNKYRDSNLTLSLYTRGNATAGNVTLTITDLTNMVTLATQSLSFTNDKHGTENLVSFDVPLTCALLGYQVTALAEAGTPNTFVDDISIYLTPSELVQTLLFTESDSMIRVNTQNGNGSTATSIRRFSNLVESYGNSILYADSATLGSSFTILEDGIYEISYNDEVSTLVTIAITKNASALTGTSEALAANQRLATSTGSANFATHCSWQGRLVAGDVIRPFNSGAATGDSNTGQFTIAKQGNLKQINTNADSKITIPRSELRMEQASTRGSTDTFIVRFDTLTKVTGSAFTVVSNATNGTAITITKAGLLTVNAALSSGGSINIAISKNQAVLTAAPTISETLSGSSGSNEATPVSWSGMVAAGDVIRISSSVNPSASTTHTLNLIHQEQDVAVNVTNILPKFTDGDSSVRVDTANGYGSTATKIRRFSNVRNNLGTDIAYIDDAALGGSWTVNSDGIYSLSLTDYPNAGTAIGISRNASSLTTNIDTLAFDPANTASVLAWSTAPANSGQSVSWQGFLAKNDVIRVHTQGTAATDNDAIKFVISKAGKPNITNVDVTPFINIPQPTIGSSRLEAAASRGSTATFVVYYPNIISDGNNGLYTISTDSTLGTRITVLKRGVITINATLVGAAANQGSRLSKNQAVLTAHPVLSETVASTQIASGTTSHSLAYTGIASIGDVFRVTSDNGLTAGNSSLNVTMEVQADSVLMDVESFSSDTTPLTYASSALYTLATLPNAPVGTFITYTIAAGGNVKTQTTTAPTQTVGDMAANGIRLYTRAYGATSTAALPAVIAIQVGKGYKGLQSTLYKTAGKITTGTSEFYLNGGAEYGARWKEYNESTGVLLIDVGTVEGSGISTKELLFSDVTTQTNGYFVINASKNPALLGVVLKDKYFTSYGLTGATGAGSNVSAVTRLADNCGAWNGTQFFVPETGTYRVSYHFTFSLGAGGAWSVSLFRNGSAYRGMGSYGNGPAGGSGMGQGESILVDMVKGEIYSIVCPTVANGMTAGPVAGDFGHISFESVNIRG